MRRSAGGYAAIAVVLSLVAAACASGDSAAGPATTQSVAESTTTAGQVASGVTTPPVSTSSIPPKDGLLRNQLGYVFPDPPLVTNTAELAPETREVLEELWDTLTTRSIDNDAIVALGESGDVRLAWLMADLMRFIQAGPTLEALLTAVVTLTGVDLEADPVAARSPWQSVTDHLIAWDLPAHPEYREFKGRLFTIIEPAWQPFFDDPDATIDWRQTSWGGVLIDNRPLGDPAPCQRGCIPALDDPEVTSAADGSWYPDDRIVFGVAVNGEARAYPKNQMEVHEMVNDTIGGRRIGLPYCTLCGSAQAYFTDSLPAGIEQPVLRTSGLLKRSNKVMYDLITFSVFDTFTGEAVTGPLREQGVVLEQTTVVTSTWADWKAAYPETTIVAEDGGLGRRYSLDPLGGRDDDGPIFPVGNVDSRLPIQAEVVGVVTADGTAIAFPVDELRKVFASVDSVELAGVVVTANGGGFSAALGDGTTLAAHQSFWFAWAQFHPDTLLWSSATIGG